MKNRSTIQTLTFVQTHTVYQAGWSGRPKLPRQFVPVRNFEPRLFVPMPGKMGRPAFTFVNLYIFCNLQRIINKNIHLVYVCTCVSIF
jgi:hypothetical protein